MTPPRDRRFRAITLIRADAVIAIVRAAAPSVAESAATALLAAGVRVIEISLTTPGAVGVMARLAPSVADAGGVIGLGTVLDAAPIPEAAQLGASFIVSPVMDKTVIDTAHRHGLAAVPGALTPAECLAGLAAGADLIKLFPASSSSPESLRQMLEALGQLPIVPTGGVTFATARHWMACGAVAVGMGGGLSGLEPALLADALRDLRSAGRPAARSRPPGYRPDQCRSEDGEKET
jgi:2-dehydro-3-deoxyphosphogluconate aldolase/(4S)-4-hydroxy-2-oxoglutarate aldolase